MLKFLMCAASIFQIATDQSRPVPAGKEILHLSRLNAYRCLPEWKALGGTKIPAFRPKERKNAIPCPAAERRFPNRLNVPLVANRLQAIPALQAVADRKS